MGRLEARPLRLCVLGEIAAGPAGRIRPIIGPTQRRVLGVLIARRNELVDVSALVEACWPDGSPPVRAAHNVRTYVHRLRSSYDIDIIETAGSGYRLVTGPGDVDADEFTGLASSAARALALGDHVGTLDAAERATALWRGAPYAELGDQPWALPEVVYLDELHVAVLADRCEALLEAGRPAPAVGELEQLVRADPLRERPLALLMRALYDSGRQVEALRAFQGFRRRLIDEAGVEPSADLVELDRRIAIGEAAHAAPARVVGNYELHERIGEGAFAVVHRATQRNLGRDVALKVVRAELADEPSFIRRFEAEAQMIASIEHPNVVPLYDYWRDPGQAFLVMRWMTGGSLESRLDAGRWSIERTLGLVDQIAAALDAAHARDVVHRDVKPANILFDDDDRAFLGDFGIALAAAERTTPQAALSEGSPLFASPEQLRREPVGPEADVHALAVVAYTVLTGRAPFADAPDAASMLQRQLHDPIPPVTATRPELPPRVDTVLATATAKAPTDRYPSAGAFAAAFRRAVLGDDGCDEPPGRTAGHLNPYVGLQAFGEHDAAIFHGRRRLVHELLGHLAHDDGGLLVLVGPSGSGKSSVVRAGVLPAIRAGALPGSDRWFTTTMRPGGRPFEALETALLRVAVNPPAAMLDLLRDGDRGIVRAVKRILPDDDAVIVLIVDQFEELFTATPADERERFLRSLAVAVRSPSGPARLVATLRADFFDQPLRHPDFAPLLKRAHVAITPLAVDELEEAITRPAAAEGVEFEPGLVAEIIADVNREPGALPLLQYALRQLFETTEGSVITVADYHRIGGIAGALAQRAETLFETADVDEQRALRHVMERLVHLGEGTEDVRRRARLSELSADLATKRAIERFAGARLLTFDRDPTTREPTLEVAHEALIREWPRVRDWLDRDRDLLRVHRHLSAAATAWIARGRDPSELYRGARLLDAEHLLEADRIALNDDELEYLRAGRAAHDAEVRRERVRVRRLHRLVTVSAAAAVLALIAGIAAAIQWRRADEQADRAAVSAAEADSRAVESTAQRLAVQSLDAMEEDPDLAILLALESLVRTDGAGMPPVRGAVEALHAVTQSSRLLRRFPTAGASALHPSGEHAALARTDGGTDDLVVIDVSSGDVVTRTTTEGPVRELAFLGSGDRIVAATEQSLTVRDAGDLTRLGTTELPSATVAVVPGDEHVATIHEIDDNGGTETHVWHVRNLEHVATLAGSAGGWRGDELVIAGAGAGATATSVDVATGTSTPIETDVGEVRAVDVHPGGDRLLVATDDRLFEIGLDGERVTSSNDLGIDLGVLVAHGTYTADGSGIVAAGQTDEIVVVPSGDRSGADDRLSLRGNPTVFDVSSDSAGSLLLTSGEGEALLWDLSPGGPSELGAIPVEGQVWRAEAAADGTTLYVGDEPEGHARIRAVDAVTGEIVATDEGFGQYFGGSPIASRDGLVAGWVGDGLPGRVVDLHAGELVAELDPCAIPTSIDGDARWLVVTVTDEFSWCDGPAVTQLIDPTTGDVVWTFPDVAGSSDIGPPGTIADGLVVHQGETGIVFRDLRSGDVLGTAVGQHFPPFFSPDGRYVTVGGQEGAFAFDVERILAGDDPMDAVALNPRPQAGATSFSLVVGDRLITGHAGEVLRFWRLADGAEELTLPVDSVDSTYLFPSLEGRFLYYEDDGHLLRRFPMRTDDLVDLARRRAQRWFEVTECERFELADDCVAFAATGPPWA